MNINDYIIDFEKVNELTSSPIGERLKDDGTYIPNANNYTLSKSIIKNYLDKFTHTDRKYKNIDHIISTLEYNGIIISKSKIRSEKLSSILYNN